MVQGESRQSDPPCFSRLHMQIFQLQGLDLLPLMQTATEVKPKQKWLGARRKRRRCRIAPREGAVLFSSNMYVTIGAVPFARPSSHMAGHKGRVSGDGALRTRSYKHTADYHCMVIMGPDSVQNVRILGGVHFCQHFGEQNKQIQEKCGVLHVSGNVCVLLQLSIQPVCWPERPFFLLGESENKEQ